MKIDLSIKTNEYFSGDRPEMLKYIPSKAGRILDVGCGKGNFGAYLRKRNQAEVWGVEYEPLQAEKARTQLDKIFSGDIAVIIDQLPANYFDVIVCNDVLEHLTDPYTVLEKMRNKLTNDGVVVSSIPNIRYFRNFFDLVFRKNWDYTDNGIMDKTHYRFFTIKSIPKMFDDTGYEVIQFEGINATKSIRPVLWNALCLGFFSDIRYLQFATVAKAKK